jgi:hypothetical protein
MKRRRLHLELLLGARVHDREGKFAGHIEEVRAEQRDGQTVVKDYLLGRGALAHRLSITGVSTLAISLLGGRNNVATHRVPWDKMDLSDPRRPRLTCRAEELEAVE